jgi:uncharacterized protein (DUF2235 family)
MPKSIIICADGTGNTTIKGRGTNVFKLYEAVDGNGHRRDSTLDQQVAIYHDGVGTESLKWLRLFSGATGWGLSRNVKQLYGELARVYAPGDRIYLFGFSRGAFTARTLAGLITTCGILDVSRYASNHLFRKGIRDVYTQYRRKYQTRLSLWLRGRRTIDRKALDRHQYAYTPTAGRAEPPIVHFIGVWDTVDAVGAPLRLADLLNTVVWRFKFPDTALSPDVGHACHALAIDEPRQSFTPVLWNESQEDPAAPRIEQVWFAGAHSNVGGGYPRQGMSLVALDWMMARAEAHGLRFHADVRRLYREGADVNDKRYDSRAGLGVFYRWKPRDVQQLCERCGVTPKIHRSVFERIARGTEGYAPGSLPVRCDVVSTTATSRVRDEIAEAVADIFGAAPPLLRRTPGWRAVGTCGYWLLLFSSVALGALTVDQYVADSLALSHGLRAGAEQLADNGLSPGWIIIAARTAWRHQLTVGGAALSLVLLVVADQQLDRIYSSFWHSAREKLRAAM